MADQSEKLTASEQIMVRALYKYAARLLVDHTADEAIAILHEKGLPLDSAQTIVDDLSQAEDRVRRKMFRREILIGVGLLEAGAVAGLGAYLAIGQNSWAVWAVITGILGLLSIFWLARGLWGLWRFRQDTSDFIEETLS